jgi:hypothetical protein
LAAIGGLAALSAKESYDLPLLHRVLLSIAILLLFLYASRWISENIKREDHATDALRTLDTQLRIDDLFPEFPWRLGKLRFYFGYQWVVVGLGLVAIATIIFLPARQAQPLSLRATSSEIILRVPAREEKFALRDADRALSAFHEELNKQQTVSSP